MEFTAASGKFARFAAIVLLSILGIAGCANIVPIAPGQPFELEPGQGLLVLHLSSNVAIARMELGASGFIGNIPEGDNLWLLKIAPGSYRWTRIVLAGPGERWIGVERSDEWRFAVEAGRINYPGMIDLELSNAWTYTGRTIDRSALAVETLRKRYPGVTERFPIAYTGNGQDVFFEQYRRAAVERRSTEGPPGSTSTP